MSTILPPPPIGEAPGSFAWQQWYLALSQLYSGTGTIPWALIDTAGSNLTDIATRDHNNLQSIQGGAANDYYHIKADTFNNVVAFLNGGATGAGWNDILGRLHIQVAGANDPVWATYQGNINQYQFSNVIMNQMWFEYHIPHDYKPASDIHIHVHWSQIVVDTGGPAGVPGDVKWSFDVSYAKGHNQAAFSAPFTTSITATASGTQYQHMLSEVQLSAASPSATQLDSDVLEPDGVILVRFFRDPTDVADTLDQAPFVHYVDIHYQTDRVNTKNKAPNFYT